MAEKNAIGAQPARLLRRVAKHILADPLRYDQHRVIARPTPGAPFFYSYITKPYPAPSCGTIGCIAGWVAILLLGLEEADQVAAIEFATKTLGLSFRQQHSLFGSPEKWPEPFATSYEKAGTPQKIARVAARRIEHFIKTGE